MSDDAVKQESSGGELERDLSFQIRISKMLSYGFVFSIVWLGGIGSVIAVVSGMRALRLIRSADNRPVGEGMAWWCIVAGAVGALAGPIILILRTYSWVVNSNPAIQ